jgi:hypothetical protein
MMPSPDNTFTAATWKSTPLLPCIIAVYYSTKPRHKIRNSVSAYYSTLTIFPNNSDISACSLVFGSVHEVHTYAGECIPVHKKHVAIDLTFLKKKM